MYLGACDNIIIGNAFIFYGENLGLIMLIVQYFGKFLPKD